MNVWFGSKFGENVKSRGVLKKRFVWRNEMNFLVFLLVSL